MVHPPFSFVLIFMVFSIIFFYNTWRLWTNTEKYYNDIRSSLERTPSIYPFREFFLRLMEDRRRWQVLQKGFSLAGMIAVLAADALVITAWLSA